MSSPLPSEAQDAAALRSEARLEYLNALETITQGGKVTIHMANHSVVTARRVAAVKADFSRLVVEDLETSLGTIPRATLRGSDIIGLQVDFKRAEKQRKASRSAP